MTPDQFRKLYLNELQPTEQECKAYELAARYHRETDDYDRLVCTGPIRDGSIMPIGPHEMALSHRNATKVRKQIMFEAEQHGIDRRDMARAISKP